MHDQTTMKEQPRASSPIGIDGLLLKRLSSSRAFPTFPAASLQNSPAAYNARLSSPPADGVRQLDHAGDKRDVGDLASARLRPVQAVVPNPPSELMPSGYEATDRDNRASTPSDTTGEPVADYSSGEHALAPAGEVESWNSSLLAHSLNNEGKACGTLNALSSPLPASAIKAHPAWKWPTAVPNNTFPPQSPWGGPTWAGRTTSSASAPAAATPSAPSNPTSRTTSYLTQEQLLPSLLLCNDEPSLDTQQASVATPGNTWPITNPPLVRMNSGKLSGNNGLPPLAAAVAAAERDGLQTQGHNLIAAASAAVRKLQAANEHKQQQHQAEQMHMLSTLLEHRPTADLEELAGMDASQFDQFVLNAAASKTHKAWDSPTSTAGSHLSSPPNTQLSTSTNSSGNGSYTTDNQNLQSLFQATMTQMHGIQLGGSDAVNNKGMSSTHQQVPSPGDQHLHTLLASPDLLLQSAAHNQWQQLLGTSPSPAACSAPLPALELLGLRVAQQQQQHLLQDGTTQPVGEVGWDKLTQVVRDRVHSMVIRCRPHIQINHFDGGVRHWLLQLTVLFGEEAALSGLSTIETATNLAGVRNMRAFVTTRLIDCFEQQIFRKDPHDYIAKRLSSEQYEMVHALVAMGQGLDWSHFDPKVLDTIRNLGSLDYTRARLSRLSARDLASVQNVPAYIYTLLTKKGKTAKQAAAMKSASDAALNVLLEAASSPSPNPSPFALRSTSSNLTPQRMSGTEPASSGQAQLMLQRARTLGGPAVGSGFPQYMTNNNTFNLPMYDTGVRTVPAPQIVMPPMRSMSAHYDTAIASMQQQYHMAALALIQQQQQWQRRA